MKILETDLNDVFLIEPVVYKDKRGYFLETFRHDVLEKALGYNINFVQENESFSHKNVLRGLHYQLYPYAQAKLVRVVKGKVLDVAVDLRRGSKNFGKWLAVELSDENKRQLFIPRGFAHGFLVLSQEAILVYKVDNYYSADHEGGVRFDDPDIGVKWPISLDRLILSDKDKRLPFLNEAEVFE